jgi:hypothetical protein
MEAIDTAVPALILVLSPGIALLFRMHPQVVHGKPSGRGVVDGRHPDPGALFEHGWYGHRMVLPAASIDAAIVWQGGHGVDGGEIVEWRNASEGDVDCAVCLKQEEKSLVPVVHESLNLS